MKSEIYKAYVFSEDDAIDDLITQVVVTAELNMYVVWAEDLKEPPRLLKWFRDYEREAAIEYGVDQVREMRSRLIKA